MEPSDYDFYERKFALQAEQAYMADLAQAAEQGRIDLDEAQRIAALAPGKFSDMQHQPVWIRRANGNHAASDTVDFLGGF